MNDEMLKIWNSSNTLSAKYGLGCKPEMREGIDGINFRLDSRPHKEMWLSVEQISQLNLNDELKKFKDA